MKVRLLLPELCEVEWSQELRFRGRLTGRTADSEPAYVGSTPAPGTETGARLGRQPADHPCLNQGMLWVQLPPGPLDLVLVEQPGVLATLSRWRSWVRIPSGTLDGTVRKPAKRPSSNLGDTTVGSTPTRATEIA